MAGINRATRTFSFLAESRKQSKIECVFISHQKDDKPICRKIADYLEKAGIDVYFDEDDNDLKIYRPTNNPAGVVDCIRKGINNSSHMLVVISPNTIQSKWVPWEVGFGYDKTEVVVLTLKGIRDQDLPDYLKTTRILRGTKSLNAYIAKVAGTTEYVMESKNLLRNFSQSQHPLDNYLDRNQ